MALDRDLSVSIMRAWAARGTALAHGWEMMAGTGVRGLRVLNESGGLTELLSTERNPAAAAVLEANSRRFASRGARARAADALRPPSEAPFDWVDLDPYGSPLDGLSTALDSTRDGGLLSLTATDMIVLAGALRGASERRYQARTVPGRLGPEAGLRVLLATVHRVAAGRGRHVEPVACYVGGHHVRAWLQVNRGEPRSTPVVTVLDPGAFDGPRLPPGPPYGPLWVGALFDGALVSRLEVPARAADPTGCASLLNRFRSEAGIYRPFAYEPNEIARALRLRSPPPVSRLVEGLQDRGFLAGRSHVHPAAFRTTAPRSVVDEVARELAGA